MTQIQIKMSEKENRFITIHKAKLGFSTKAEAIVDVIRKYGGIKSESKRKR